MKAFHALFHVPTILRRFVDDTSDLFNAGCRHEIGIADGEVTKIGSVAIKAIQHYSRQSDLYFNLNWREMRKIGVVNCVGAGLGIGYAKSRVALGADFKPTIKLRVTADFAMAHECRNSCLLGCLPDVVDEWRA